MSKIMGPDGKWWKVGDKVQLSPDADCDWRSYKHANDPMTYMSDLSGLLRSDFDILGITKTHCRIQDYYILPKHLIRIVHNQKKKKNPEPKIGDKYRESVNGKVHIWEVTKYEPKLSYPYRLHCIGGDDYAEDGGVNGNWFKSNVVEKIEDEPEPKQKFEIGYRFVEEILDDYSCILEVISYNPDKKRKYLCRCIGEIVRGECCSLEGTILFVEEEWIDKKEKWEEPWEKVQVGIDADEEWDVQNNEPEYETHLWMKIELPDDRIIESPEPEGDGWVEIQWFENRWPKVIQPTDTEISRCFWAEYNKISGWDPLEFKRYHRDLPKQERYDARYPLLAKYLGG